ncbi:ExbD/TolR family protein [Thermaurantiacus tibetensis]|uniref:ExbD/TolR family protein n=1 Tax=Thermaurantiacus tibetensis TaxID=2759035 RepID=UPI00188E4FEF|nr:biopolymer transporter ExbD [Thermaurantiacus tibetensis]
MAISMGSGGEGEPMGDMNTTPLIDVMLVLLIMFIITIPIQTHAVKLDLPPPNPNPSNIEPTFNQVNIDFLNTIYWNDQEVTLDQLRTYMEQVGRLPVEQQPELRLRPDALARYEVVNQVMAIAQMSGIKKMGFVGNEAYAG